MAEESKPVENAEAPKFISVGDVEKMLAAQRQQIMSDFAAQMGGVLAAAKGESNPTDMVKVLSDLTAMIADTTNTGGNRRSIPPEETRRRMAGTERMGKLLERVRAEGLKPHYKVVDQVWLDGELIQPLVPEGEGRYRDNEILWGGAPNTGLRPMNEIATEIYDAFLQSIGGSTRIDGMREQATWMSYGGLVMVGESAPQTVSTHGNARNRPRDITQQFPTTNEVTATDGDKKGEGIAILGTWSPPAQRLEPGRAANLSFSTSR